MLERLRRVNALTFDCYGTIIDWDGGIRRACASLEELAGLDLDQLLADREELEAEIEAGPFRLYGAVLAESLLRATELQDRTISAETAHALAFGMSRWRPFPDSAEALRRLVTRYRLGIVSNVENSVLAESVAPLGVSFETFVTAEDVESYKPARAHFDEVLRRFGLDKEDVLHVAGSLFHDVRPVRKLGWDAVWINRRGEPVPDDLDPALVFPNLATLAAALDA